MFDCLHRFVCVCVCALLAIVAVSFGVRVRQCMFAWLCACPFVRTYVSKSMQFCEYICMCVLVHLQVCLCGWLDEFMHALHWSLMETISKAMAT